mmetsp:Transcript_7207/g.13666  ORF Transcript_7207/g.13666 Transcript_7207/m.13666 type:complete len:631 (-) Transcript_7207:188-2080(-)|eukprot:CAMPEP_0175144420 /NCGR_PEP_ID=MMETSP0087-20121206/14126_1 /TAXON_ID=136419 /ORGANISM="Unknown Unknown, Strain D1" /LENGTH=630 /DNA_ID=CAMNT_0016428895 /DNA_START=36 /DNA_END=1928 /DNA_ORIENTATION=+
MSFQFGGKKKGKDEGEKEPERILKLKECCDMLLAAGYFRARISSLSPFDKVVGGMCWAITASGASVSVDILFQENSTIGQRIKLSENLVKALLQMKCPLPLQSHQIQGLDYDNLFPILQWLVRKVLETRRLTGDLVRALSVSQFDKTYSFPGEKLSDEAREFVGHVQDNYKPSRVAKQREGATFDNENARVEATLLEYGEKLYGSVVYDEEKEDKRAEKNRGRSGGKIAAGAKMLEGDNAQDKDAAAAAALAQAREEEEKRLDLLAQQLSEDGAAVNVTGSSVGKIITMQANEIQKAAADYEEEMKKQALEGDDAAFGKRGEEQAFCRQKEALERKVQAEQQLVEKKRGEWDALQARVDELRAAAAKKNAYMQRIVQETAKLEAIEQNAENKDVLGKLKALVLLNESLKSQEEQFKKSCVEQRAKLLAMMKELEDGENDEETQRMMEIEKIYNTDMAKMAKLRQVLAKKNQEIAKVTRAMDDIPTRAELLQYERRFVELYELVQDKLTETRKYYEFYNTLNDVYKYMSNEESLLNSINDGFPKAIKSKTGTSSFLESFKGILANVETNKEHAKKECDNEELMRDTLQQKYSSLLDRQRKYFKAVKENQEECIKNEKLQATLDRMMAAQGS